MRFAVDQQVLHTYAVWRDWAFDHSGWNPEPQLLEVNMVFEGRPLERVKITDGLIEFCEQFDHRRPHQYWRDPRPRARDYIRRHSPPWPSRRRLTIRNGRYHRKPQ
jgi:hypothetical protein